MRFAAGFNTAEIFGGNLNVTESPVLDRKLEVGAQSEQVTVEGVCSTPAGGKFHAGDHGRHESTRYRTPPGKPERHPDRRPFGGRECERQ